MKIDIPAFKHCFIGGTSLLTAYGSHDGADISVVYHTFVESCKLACISVKDYFVKFFESIASGRTDYENLLPTTIGLKQ